MRGYVLPVGVFAALLTAFGWSAARSWAQPAPRLDLLQAPAGSLDVVIGWSDVGASSYWWELWRSSGGADVLLAQDTVNQLADTVRISRPALGTSWMLYAYAQGIDGAGNLGRVGTSVPVGIDGDSLPAPDVTVDTLPPLSATTLRLTPDSLPMVRGARAAMRATYYAGGEPIACLQLMVEARETGVEVVRRDACPPGSVVAVDSVYDPTAGDWVTPAELVAGTVIGGG